MELFAIVYLDTNGRFKVLGLPSQEDADFHEGVMNDSGIPTVRLTRDQIITGVA